MQEHRTDPWWYLHPSSLESPPPSSTNLHHALEDLLQTYPDQLKSPPSAPTLQQSPPLPPLLPYLQTIREIIPRLHDERMRAPDRVAAYSQRLFQTFQHLRHAFLSIEQELRWLDPNHPLLNTLTALLQDIHRDIAQVQQFIKTFSSETMDSSPTPLSFEEDEVLQPPHASHISPLYGVSVSPNAPSKKDTPLGAPETPPPPPLSAEEIQQKLFVLQQTSKSGVRLNIAPPPSSAQIKSEISPVQKSENIEKTEPPSLPSPSLTTASIPSPSSVSPSPSSASLPPLPKPEEIDPLQLFEAHDPNRLSPPPKSSPKSKTKDIPATIERISNRVEQVADTSTFRCAINELEQAKRIIPNDVWGDLCARLVQRAQNAHIEENEWDKFNNCRSFLQRRSLPTVPTPQEPSYAASEPPDSKYRGRFRDLLDDKFFSMYRKLVDDVCGTPMNYIDRHSPDERFHMFSIWSAQARWVQEQLPDDEIGVQNFLRTLFGRINSARKEYLGHGNYWIEPLNRQYYAEWPSYINEHEQKLQQVRQDQQAQQLVEAEREERAWQQEMRVYAWLSKLRQGIRALPQPASAEDPATLAFLQVLREILEEEMSPSDTDLLELIDPYEDLIQSGSEFRHLRRHLRKLKEQSPEERGILTLEDPQIPITPAPEQVDDAYSYQLQRRRDAKKLRSLLPIIQERNAAIIGGDEREQARERLQTMLQLKSLEWIPREGGNPRVLDRLEERIASGKVTLVLLLIRYCGHDTTRIIHACKRAGALWPPSITVMESPVSSTVSLTTCSKKTPPPRNNRVSHDILLLCDDVRSFLHIPIHGRFGNRPYIIRARDTRISNHICSTTSIPNNARPARKTF